MKQAIVICICLLSLWMAATAPTTAQFGPPRPTPTPRVVPTFAPPPVLTTPTPLATPERWYLPALRTCQILP